MSVSKETIEIGRCYKFDGGQIRKVVNIKFDQFQSIPYDGVMWGLPVWINKDKFADEALSEVDCPE